MPTEKLYWVQPLLQRFESRLVSQEQTADLSGAYRIQLEKTAFLSGRRWSACRPGMDQWGAGAARF
jgi:hypothetical protein